MKIEERVASAIRAQTEQLPPRNHDLAVIRAAAKAQSRRRVGVVVAAAAVVAAVASGVTVLGARQPAAVGPIAPGPPSTTPAITTSPDVDPLDSRDWTTYRSERYDFDIGHPSDWTVEPSERDWSSDADSSDPLSPAHEAFESPSGDVRVSAWSVPIDAATRQESNAYLVAWVEDYCEATGNTPCTGIGDRAVELCLEKWDCHPGLLVPFQNDVQAFFSGGIYDAGAMTVVAVWRGESRASVAPYGGAQRLLEGFLSTMQVWPASTPKNQRR